MRPSQRPDGVPTASETDATSSTGADPSCVDVVSEGADETQRIGEMIGRLLQPGDLLLLQGKIGAGKTTFTQGVARGMGLTSRVTSPSFTLANVYRAGPGGFPLYHLDLWRIASAVEALGIGLDEYLTGEGACIVEWPDVAETVLPSDFVRVRFAIDGDRRELSLCPVGGARPRALVEEIRATLVGCGGPRAPRA
jgi:tRNA threonylcarbamoyladenosine biosynthesis protein TsaE